MKKASPASRQTIALPDFEPGQRPGSPGQPQSPLPLWTNLPLDAKIPLPPVVPKGKAVLCTTQIGEPLWRTPSDELGMDLDDPLLMQLPGPHQYNPLQDPFASGFLYQPRLRSMLYRHQLITRKADVLATLKNFNRFRDYLHSIRLRQLKKEKVDVELPLRTEYENLALDVVNEFRENEDLTQANEGPPLSDRFSDIMRTEEEKLPAQKPLFQSLLTAKEKECLEEKNRRFSSIRFAKLQNRESRLVAIKDWLRKDGRKGALIRLRRLQLMEERRKKGINNWKTRTSVQYEYFEELERKERLEAEIRRAQLTAKYRYRSAMNIAHDGKYDEIVRRWREKRLRSKRPDFCGYAEQLDLRSTFMGSHDSTKEYADVEIQTDDNTEADRLLRRKSLQFLLVDRSAGLTDDITEECEEKIQGYEKAAKEQYEAMIYVQSEVICPAVAEYVGGLGEDVADGGESRENNRDVSTQTSLADVSRVEEEEERSGSESDSREGAKRLGLTVPVPLHKTAGSAASSNVDEVVFGSQENEVLDDSKEGDAKRAPAAAKEVRVDDQKDLVQLLHQRLCDLERAMSDVAAAGDDSATGAESSLPEAKRAIARGTRVLNRAIAVRRSSALVAMEVVREALDGIGRELEGLTCGGKDSQPAPAAVGKRRRPTRSARLRQEVKAQRESCFTRLALYFVRKAMSTGERLVHGATDAEEEGRERSSSAGDQGSDFVRSFLDGVAEGARNDSLSAKQLLNLSAEFNRDICRTYEDSFLTDLETAQLAKDRYQIEANQIVTTCIDDVVNDLQAEGLTSMNFNLPSEANLAFSEALLNLSLHRDLEGMLDDRKDMDFVLEFVLRVLQTHAQLTSQASFPSRELLEDAYESGRYVLGSVLLGRLISMALEKLGDVRDNCEMTAGHYIALAVGLDLQGLVCRAKFKKSRAKRGAIDQRKLREALAEIFERKLKCQTDGQSDLLPAVCAEKAISEAVEKVYRSSLPCLTDHRRAEYTPSSAIEIEWSLEAAAKDVIGTAVTDVAAKFRAAIDDSGELESCLAEIDSVLIEMDIDNSLGTESHLGLLARNSIDVSLEHFRTAASTKNFGNHASTEDINEEAESVQRIAQHRAAGTKIVRLSINPSDDGSGFSSAFFDRDSATDAGSSSRDRITSGVKLTTATTSSLHSALKAPAQASDVALETLDLSIVPMFGSVPLNIHPDLVSEDLLMLSVKHDEDLDNPDLSMRNSFRNVHRPDVSGLIRFSSMGGQSGSDHDSVHDRVRGAYMRRRSTTEEVLRRDSATEDAPEYVTKVTSVHMDSIAQPLSEDSQENGQETSAPPDQSTVTVEYSKQYAFPDDPVLTEDEPVVTQDGHTLTQDDHLVVTYDHLVVNQDDQSLVSYVLGETDEFHHLNISSMAIEEEAGDKASGSAGHHDPARKLAEMMISEEADKTKSGIPENESDEVIIATNDLVVVEMTADEVPDESDPIDTADKTDIVGVDLEGDGPGGHETTVTPAADAAAAKPWSIDENLPTIVARLTAGEEQKSSSKVNLVDKSVVSLPLPPVPVNSAISKVDSRDPLVEDFGHEDPDRNKINPEAAILEESSREAIVPDPEATTEVDPDDDVGASLTTRESYEKLEVILPENVETSESREKTDG